MRWHRNRFLSPVPWRAGGLALVACVLAGLVAAAGPANAHANEATSEPAADSVLEQAPDQVRVSFDSPLLAAGAALVVRASDGSVVSTDPPIIDDRTIATTLKPAPAGRFEVAYRVVSEDGHAVTGTFAFTVEGTPSPAVSAAVASESTAAESTAAESTASMPASASPSPGAGQPVPDSGPRVAVILGFGIAAVVVLAVLFVLARRQSRRGHAAG